MSKHNESKIRKACNYLQEEHDATYASEYGEPGYANPERGIIFANWNNVAKGLGDWLEKCGYALEWSDEWTEVNGKAYRTSPDSYSWESSLIYCDGEYLTRDDSPSDIIDHVAMTDHAQDAACLPSWVHPDSLTEEGYELISAELENGHHPGQTDNPAEYARRAFDRGAIRVVFRKTENSQFYVKFECWAQFEEPQFDRFDICAAYKQLESDYNVGGILRERPSCARRNASVGVQLARMGFSDPNPPTINAWAIYRLAVKRLRLPV